MYINQILQDIPLFRHCSDEEISILLKIGKIEIIKKNKKIDQKKTNSLHIVLNGIFIVEGSSKNNIAYISTGSFFGIIPFTIRRIKGFVKALTDSTLIIFDIEEVYKFYLNSYKGLRGYIKTIDRMGFEISETGKIGFTDNSKIITVYSPYKNSGKSIFSSLLGLSLSPYGNTAILDMSINGNSIFSIFEKNITPALAQKRQDHSSQEKLINESTLKIDKNLFLLNMTFDSKINMNPDIISPILYLLSKKYRYMIIDFSSPDRDIRDRVFNLSDIIFTIIKKNKDKKPLFNLFDKKLREGQRVYYILNKFYSPNINKFEGGYTLENLEFTKDESFISNLSKYINNDISKKFVQLIVSGRKGLVIETSLMESVLFTSLLSALHKSDKKIDLIYSSSMGFLIVAILLLAKDINDFEKNALRYFSEDKFKNFLDITFPEKYIFKNNKISRFANELSKDNRIEFYKTLPIVMLTDEMTQSRRIFSTGYFKDLVSSSLLLYPIYQSYKIAGKSYYSGFPSKNVRVEDLFRMDIDKVIYTSLKSNNKFKPQKTGPHEFYNKYIDHLNQFQSIDRNRSIADKNIIIDIENIKLNSKELSRISEKIAAEL